MRMKPALLSLFLLAASPAALPCTLYGAAGAAAGGGTLMAKVRDQLPGSQVLRTVVPEKGYAYRGLFVGKRPTFNMGINSAGLAAGLSTAGSVPKKKRLSYPRFRGPAGERPLEYLMERCATVEEALAAKEVFDHPANFILADRTEVAIVEVLPDLTRTVRRVKNGTAAHTNHYIEPGSERFNEKIGESSAARLSRIRSLLASRKAFSLQDFIAMGHDRSAGPDDSIWRTGEARRERTIAFMAVRIPASGAPQLHLEWEERKDDPKSLRSADETPFPGAPAGTARPAGPEK
ncbi:carcinine hydrolase/isopenicillin-N N-acyltransferase family protein [Mesosutterella sp. AGMB02718]|uniref:Carcinine hydrolase/isopenicillin-N N-acyltransferase family protein n=1 Tax=Mesosutterella faecium TaxID=2925194 RepID=A0ABT7ILX1_9BURK|nr:carcinine hydrolase/isopenicillin-N N-acyltransferase family protein [Mesosutterella sp. AGMB02718]MDL2059349.1 carcinine hydrolase/isopenicillin-N N-acyltransferase family protein [Mesosutterella sp. AGMB02718]